MKVVFRFLVLHFYTFVLFMIYWSFRLFADQQLSGRVVAVAPPLQITERLDDRVVATHVLHRSAARKRLAATDNDHLYGVSRVSVDRARHLGYKRKLLGYQRVGDQITVPANSADSRRCDLWTERQDVTFLVKCRPSDGEQACFNCVESRQYVRKCVRLTRPMRLYTSALAEDYIDVPANEEPDQGYCMSSVFANTVMRDQYRPADQSRNCNPNTGEWLLARLSLDSTASYNWLCRCRYPNLMTNQTTVFSDCTRPVGCQPYGQLDEASRAGRVNPYTEGRCVCELGYRADRDPTVGPVCVPRVIVTEDDPPQDVYRRYNVNLEASLAWPTDNRYLDSRLANVLGNSERELRVPNPCRYDVQTGRLINEVDSCRLITEQLDNEPVAYCITNSFNAVPVRSDRDYLRNNNGRYANACLLVNHSTVKSTSSNAILSYQNSLDGVNRRPDFGLLFEKSPQLQRIVDSIAVDSRWLAFQRNVQPPAPVEQAFHEPGMQMFGGATDKWFSVYEQTPPGSRTIDGLMRQLLFQLWPNEKFGGIVYNLRNREYYWYRVNNPLGNVHWNNGLRSEIVNAITYSSYLYPGSQKYYEYDTIPRHGFAYRKNTEHEMDYTDVGENASRLCTGLNPGRYPPMSFVFPFASGADIDDAQFAKQWYPTICPIYKVKTPRPADMLEMPFVYNTRFDLIDSTLTLHLFGTRDLYLAAERLCGNYKNHQTLMRGRLQGEYV